MSEDIKRMPTVVQQLEAANARIQELTKLKAERAAQLATLNTSIDGLQTKLAAKVACGDMSQAQAQAAYAKLPPTERKAFRQKNWRLLGIEEEK